MKHLSYIYTLHFLPENKLKLSRSFYFLTFSVRILIMVLKEDHFVLDPNIPPLGDTFIIFLIVYLNRAVCSWCLDEQQQKVKARKNVLKALQELRYDCFVAARCDQFLSPSGRQGPFYFLLIL